MPTLTPVTTEMVASSVTEAMMIAWFVKLVSISSFTRFRPARRVLRPGRCM